MKYHQLIKPGLIGIAMVALVAGAAQAGSPQSKGAQGHWQMAGGDLIWVGPYKDNRKSEGASNKAALAALQSQRAQGHWQMAGGDLMWIPGTAQTAQKRK